MLTGRTVVTTRDSPGRLDQLLAERGALVLHAPLIRIEPGEPGWDTGLARLLTGAAWLVVTSQHGARAAEGLVGAEPRLAAVGTRTAEALAEAAGRPVDLVPDRQTAADLADAFPVAAAGELAVVLQGDLAGPALVEGLRAKGYTVVARTAYRTLPESPDRAIRGLVVRADAVTFASGSAARAWVAALGPDTPRVVVAIGPTTAAAVEAAGIHVTHVAATADLVGLADAVVAALVE